MDPEEEILSNFFTNVTQLCFDKAKEIVERAREGKQGPLGSWGMLLTHLAPLVVAERSYLDLGSMITKNKSFLRKDNSLRAMYDTMRSDFRRVEDFARQDRPIAVLAVNLCQFLSARIELIDFYEKMHQVGTSKNVKIEELLVVIEDITQRYSHSIAHISLTAIKMTLSFECEILVHLLKAHVEMQMWHFVSSLLSLHGAQTRLANWERKLQSREVWKLGSFLKTNQLPALFQWLVKLKNVSVSKFSLYFHSILAQQTSITDMKILCNKQTFDPYNKIQMFQKKYDASCVMLIFDARGLDDYCGPGYHHPKKPVETLKDMECFPIMVSYPMNPVQHLPNVTRIIIERNVELASSDKVMYSFSPKDQRTYLLMNIDPRVTMVVIFDSKKADRETHVNNFFQEMTVHLKCTKVFADLKPTSK